MDPHRGHSQKTGVPPGTVPPVQNGRTGSLVVNSTEYWSEEYKNTIHKGGKVNALKAQAHKIQRRIKSKYIKNGKAIFAMKLSKQSKA